MSSTACRSRALLPWISLATFLLAADAIVSLALVSSMVAFLHGFGRGPFHVVAPDDDGSGSKAFLFSGEPVHLVTNTGHVTNGAGGTALVLVGFGGLIALIVEWRSRGRDKLYLFSSVIYSLWCLIALLSLLLTLAALVYAVVETRLTSSGPGGHQPGIDLLIAYEHQYPQKYPDGKWTPETWYTALLRDVPLGGELPVAEHTKRVIRQHLRLMRAWRWNLIALFVLGLILVVLLAVDILRGRKKGEK